MASIWFVTTSPTRAPSGTGSSFFAGYNKALKAELALSATPYLIAPFGERPLTRYGLKLEADAIKII